MLKKIASICFLVCFAAYHCIAQCPMCRMSVESNLNEGGSAGRTLNTGILYMLVMPYILVGIIGYIWYKNKKRAEQAEANAHLN